jgi:hypothetical protein
LADVGSRRGVIQGRVVAAQMPSPRYYGEELTVDPSRFDVDDPILE